MGHLKEYSSIEDLNLGPEIKIKMHYLDIRYKLRNIILRKQVASYDQDIPLDRTIDINIMLFSSK